MRSVILCIAWERSPISAIFEGDIDDAPVQNVIRTGRFKESRLTAFLHWVLGSMLSIAREQHANDRLTKFSLLSTIPKHSQAFIAVIIVFVCGRKPRLLHF